MPFSLRSAAAAAASLLTSLALPTAAIGAASSHAHAQAAGTTSVMTTAAPGPFLLLDGAQVVSTAVPGGGHAAQVLHAPGRGPATSTVTAQLHGGSYVIPLVAVPYLGRRLSLSLFSLTALTKAERHGRLPVTLRYQGRARPVPGITVTHAAAGMARGYLTRASATRFATALTRQFASDHAHGRYGADGLFAGHLSISLAGASAGPARSRPDFPMHTLTVTGTDMAGHPDTFDAVLVDNVTSPGAVGTGLADFTRGVAKFSVPSGTYWAVGLFAQLSSRGRIVAARLHVLPQFRVSGNTTVHTRARAATSKVTLVTPRPAVSRTSTLSLERDATRRSGSQAGGLALTGFEVPLWVNHIRKPPSRGALQAYTSAQMTSPPGPGVPYAYTLNIIDRAGIIPPQRFVVHRADLATVSERYVQDVHSVGGWITQGGTPSQIGATGIGGEVLPLRLPGRQVQYLSANGTLWQSMYIEYKSFFDGQTVGGQADRFRRYSPGQQLTQTWNQYPLHPGTNVVLPGNRSELVRSSAARAGNMLSLDVTPFTDNQRGHEGDGLLVEIPGKVNHVSGSYALYQNGVKMAGGNAVTATGGFGDVQVSARLAPRPSAIKFVLTASRAGQQYPQSAVSRDIWTWRSRPEPAATIPAPWLCDFAPRPVDEERHCAVQPMMTFSYSIAGLHPNGATPPGHQAITVTASHIQLAPATPITATSVQVSFNNGKTWHRAAIRRLGRVRFLATFTAPAAVAVTLRVAGRDRGGASLTENLLNAYRTSS
jgi:hypothetical protein